MKGEKLQQIQTYRVLEGTTVTNFMPLKVENVEVAGVQNDTVFQYCIRQELKTCSGLQFFPNTVLEYCTITSEEIVQYCTITSKEIEALIKIPSPCFIPENKYHKPRLFFKKVYQMSSQVLLKN